MTSLLQSRPLVYYVIQSPYTKVINFIRCLECLGSLRAHGRRSSAGLAVPSVPVAVLWAFKDEAKEEVAIWLGDLPINSKGEASYMLEPVGPWPREVGMAVADGSEEGNGLHNVAATLQTKSPEFEGLPVTEMGVPILTEMTDEQKVSFLSLCGIGV